MSSPDDTPTDERSAPEIRGTDGDAPLVAAADRPGTWASAIRRRLPWVRRAAFVGAAIAVVFMWLDDRFGWLEYQPGGTAFFTYVRPFFYGLLALGALIAIRWELAGGAVVGFASGAIGAFVVNQLIGRHAAFVIALLAIPALLWVATDVLGWSRRAGAIGLAVAFAATAAGAGVGEYAYERSFGPTHPSSGLAPLPPSALRWIWAGGVTHTAAAVRASLADESAREVRLAITREEDLATATDVRFVDADSRDGPLVAFTAGGLEPDTTYRYAVEVDGRLDTTRSGSLRTFPLGPASFSFTIGSCARVGSNGEVFETVAAEDPLVHLIAGDFHYGDIPDDDRERYDEVIDLTLRQPAQAALYRATPIAYVWDDHDYGVNDSDSFSPSRLAAMQAYRANVPSYELAGELSAVYQRFDIGRVRFLLTDARSAREPGVSVLGQEQLDWFLEELVVGAAEQALVVWLNPIPWVADESEGADHWGGFPEERRLIADTIAEHDIDNLLMVSGDAHMVAIDDGTNTDYSTAGGAGFPLVHAAALDRPGGTKGGPYSHGAIGGSGQYAVVHVDDDGEQVAVTLLAKQWDGEVLLSHEFVVGGT